VLPVVRWHCDLVDLNPSFRTMNCLPCPQLQMSNAFAAHLPNIPLMYKKINITDIQRNFPSSTHHGIAFCRCSASQASLSAGVILSQTRSPPRCVGEAVALPSSPYVSVLTFVSLELLLPPLSRSIPPATHSAPLNAARAAAFHTSLTSSSISVVQNSLQSAFSTTYCAGRPSATSSQDLVPHVHGPEGAAL